MTYLKGDRSRRRYHSRIQPCPPLGEISQPASYGNDGHGTAGSIYDSGIDIEKLWPLTEHFKKVRKELADEFKLTMPAQINPAVRKYQIPGGMLTNLYNQLKNQGAEDRFDDVLAEMPNVRRDLGLVRHWSHRPARLPAEQQR